MSLHGLKYNVLHVCVYLNEQLEKSSHLLDLELEFLSDGVEQAGGGFNTGQPLHGNKHSTLCGCGGLDQLSLGHQVTHKYCRRKKYNSLFTYTGNQEKKKVPFRTICISLKTLNFIKTD